MQGVEDNEFTLEYKNSSNEFYKKSSYEFHPYDSASNDPVSVLSENFNDNGYIDINIIDNKSTSFDFKNSETKLKSEIEINNSNLFDVLIEKNENNEQIKIPSNRKMADDSIRKKIKVKSCQAIRNFLNVFFAKKI